MNCSNELKINFLNKLQEIHQIKYSKQINGGGQKSQKIRNKTLKFNYINEKINYEKSKLTNH